MIIYIPRILSSPFKNYAKLEYFNLHRYTPSKTIKLFNIFGPEKYYWFDWISLKSTKKMLKPVLNKKRVFLPHTATNLKNRVSIISTHLILKWITITIIYIFCAELNPPTFYHDERSAKKAKKKGVIVISHRHPVRRY